jgi:vesicle-associated membrane protein 4
LFTAGGAMRPIYCSIYNRVTIGNTETFTLSDTAQLLRRSANRKRKEMWWKEMKLKLCLFTFIIIVVVVLVIVAIIEIKKAS